MANNKYTREDLHKATGIVKRTLINQFRKGSRSKITKNEVFDMIYPKVGLSSRRSLWSSPYIDYLNNWYLQLENELNDLKTEALSFEKVVLPKNGETVEDLMRILTKKKKYIALLENRSKKLSSENEQLRVDYNGKYTKIDFEKEKEFPF